jgi:isopentenyl diphosphate isomerase/L-lactate dehydrogenase-like FMN-dependent dehydrogenase
MAHIIDGKAIASAVREQVAENVARFHDDTGRRPGLATVLIGDDPASGIYVGGKQKACKEVGIAGFDHRLSPDATHDEVAGRLAELPRTRLAVQLGGAAGTLAGHGDRALDVVAALADELELAEPLLPWHTDRTRIAEIAGVLGATAGVVAKIARDVILLAQSEVGEVAEAAPGGWFQAYLPGEPPRITALIERVARAGFETLVLTVDTAVGANRENNVRNGFSTPLKPNLRLAFDGLVRPGWLLGTAARTVLRHGMPHFENSYATRGAPIISRNVLRDFGLRDHLNWEHVDLIRRAWRGRLVLKGVLAPEDARRAREAGVDGVIVSNHGGRQLDGAVSPLRVLPDVAAEAGGMAVMMDGGVRRGNDVLKALAFGADFVFVGRPFLYAAAIGGEAGVLRAIGILSEEVDRNMALLGITSLDRAGLKERLRPISREHRRSTA